MDRSVIIEIVASGIDGESMPGAEDFIRQINDFLEFMGSIEKSVADEKPQFIKWKIKRISMNSPIMIELTPTPAIAGLDISNGSRRVMNLAAYGLNQIFSEPLRPELFSDDTFKKADSFLKDFSTSEYRSVISFIDEGKPINRLSLNQENSAAGRRNIEQITAPQPKPYREIGSVEGYIWRVERDGFGRPVLWIDTRIEHKRVKCVAQGNALDRLKQVEVGEVWKGLRIRVFGDLHFKSLGDLDQVEMDHVQFFESDDRLPSMDAIIDPDFTLGVESTEYLRRIREDG